MQIEQKAIVLRTKEYCIYCVKNKGGGLSVYLGYDLGLVLGLERGLEDAVRCKENALAKTENRLKNAFGSSTAYDVAGHFSDSRRANQSRFFYSFRYYYIVWSN